MHAPSVDHHERLRVPLSRYHTHQPLSPDDIILLRVYLRSWIDDPEWDRRPKIRGELRLLLAALRTRVRDLQSRKDIDRWIDAVRELGMDPKL